MWGFAWMFWVVPLFFFLMMRRRRRWERWAMMQGGYGPRQDGGKVERELEGQRSYIDELETRIAQLEERLDFTERLVSGRRDG
ncbi:MAG: hypothetical protein ACREL3_06020 [Gemmatimonadales bacterium]